MAGETNSTSSFIRMILVSLCANFHHYDWQNSEVPCRFKSDYFYELRKLKGKTLRLTTLQKLPLSGAYMKDGLLRGQGVAFDLVHELQDHIGFNYTITMPNENVIGNETSGLIKLLKNNEVDIAVVFMPMLQKFREDVLFSSELAEFEWVLLMARPSASAKGSGLLAPFQKTVWILILVSLIVVGPTIYLLIYIRIRLCKNDHTLNKHYPLPSCVWFVYGALMKQGSTLSPVSDSSRLLFATWWIFITILTSFYTANLTAFLTLSDFTLTIEKIKDIYDHKRHWVVDTGGYAQNIIDNEINDEVLMNLKSTVPALGHYINETQQQRLARVANGQIYISEKKKAQMMVFRDYVNKTESKEPENERCPYVLSPKRVLNKPVAFGYPHSNRSLKHLLDPMLMYFVHGGIIDHLLEKELPLTTICPLNLASRERKLKNTDLFTTYKIVGVGFASALIAFIGEVAHRFHKSGYRFNEIKTSSMKSAGKKEPGKTFPDETSYKNALNDNFVISQYYNEIVSPYHRQYSENQDYVLVRVQERGNKLMTDNQPTFLFQYAN